MFDIQYLSRAVETVGALSCVRNSFTDDSLILMQPFLILSIPPEVWISPSSHFYR